LICIKISGSSDYLSDTNCSRPHVQKHELVPKNVITHQTGKGRVNRK
jgi:hypothetical protein